MEGKIIILASCPLSLVNFRLHLMLAFKAHHFDVIAMAPYDEKIAKTLASHGIKFIGTPLARNGRNPAQDIINLIKLYRIIKREQPRYFFSYTIKPVIYGSLAARWAKVPNIYAMITGTGYVFSKQSLMSNIVGVIAKLLFKNTLKFNKKVFFQNPDNADLFIKSKLLPKPEMAVTVNGSGVDIHHFNHASLTKKPTNPTHTSFIMIARLLRDKGVNEYVAAARILKRKFPQAQFKLVGWIDSNPNAISERDLKQWIDEGVIDYLGRLDDVRTAIAACDVYVLPSYAEGTPRTVLEAMAIGRPIVTTNVPGCKETVVHGENGWLVSAKSVDELANAMAYFVENPDEIVRMGNKSREIVVTKYDVHKVNAHMLQHMGMSNWTADAAVQFPLSN